MQGYQERWPQVFEAIATPISSILGDHLTAIYHIGSTAVPGLCAKPVIDVMPVVFDLSAVDAKQAELEALGYEWRGENGITGRRYLSRDSDRQNPERPAVHVHIFDAFSLEVEKHLAFRDTLRHDDQIRDRYATLKRDLAQKHSRDRKTYQSSKAPFIAEVTARAMAGEGIIRLPIQISVWLTTMSLERRHFLLLKRSPARGDFWQGVTGAPYPTETLSDAAKREISEETGIACPHAPRSIGIRYKYPASPEWQKSYRPEVLQIVEEVFVVELATKTKPYLSTEHVAWQWVDADTASTMLHWPNNVVSLRAVENGLDA